MTGSSAAWSEGPARPPRRWGLVTVLGAVAAVFFAAAAWVTQLPACESSARSWQPCLDRSDTPREDSPRENRERG